MADRINLNRSLRVIGMSIGEQLFSIDKKLKIGGALTLLLSTVACSKTSGDSDLVNILVTPLCYPLLLIGLGLFAGLFKNKKK